MLAARTTVINIKSSRRATKSPSDKRILWPTLVATFSVFSPIRKCNADDNAPQGGRKNLALIDSIRKSGFCEWPFSNQQLARLVLTFRSSLPLSLRHVQEIIASWLTQKNAFDLRSIFLSCCTDRYAIGQLMSFSTYFARLWNEKTAN